MSEIGGVYADSEKVKPSPYLEHIKNRNITTTTGQELTLINPAYFLRLAMERYETEEGISSKITNTHFLNPKNKPIEWEERALNSLKRGEKEFIEFDTHSGNPELHFMRPIMIQKGCINCHDRSTYEEGKLGGGISVTVPLKNHYALYNGSSWSELLLTHIYIFIVLLVIIIYLTYRQRKSDLDSAEMLKNTSDYQRQLLWNTRLAGINEITAGVGHEINNPLTILKGNLLNLRSKMVDKSCTPDDLTVFINTQEKMVHKIASIVSGLKTFTHAKEEEGKRLSINGRITEVVKLISETFSQEGITIHLKLDPNNAFIEGTPSKFDQILLNILSNSKDALKNVTDALIHINTSVAKQFVQIDIIDNGVGIKEEDITKIFNSFFSTKPVGEGAGLGLTICKHLTTEMGGTISVQSTEKEGTTFSIRFPVAPKMRG